ncbi:cell division ATP-binding protein FtsE [Flagellimonas sediminis]|uniref:Cell division ATP-binding protein FtsE n=1 Tax=Flagellimonas sediminis TaxID=2696468 RepID=A0A6I5KRQ0_9FLAO|nr:ATP-binding cassette domain-containing protein [Allomuricauda sediminis]NDV43574.1 ATP-binding cassette domain-containing protein [Allomuricauda sediminis]
MPETIVKLQDVAVFQNENMVLNHIDLEVKKGEFVYVIGKTGSGKSSFMKTLYADLPLKQGEGNVVDFDLKMLKEKDIPFLRRKLGIVFQDFKLLSDRNVNNNLQFVLKATGWTDPKKMSDKIEEVLTKVGMKTKGFKFPHELSGGEQQRIAIARALLNDPELILADEPTGNLDPQTSVEVMKVLQDINQNGRTIIMATHDYALILKYPHKTLKCDGSKVFEVIQKAI